MININKDSIKLLKNIYNSADMEESTMAIRNNFTNSGEDFSIFSLVSKLDTMVILYGNDTNQTSTRYISFSSDERKNYLVLSAGRSIEQMRFDAACMLKEVVKRISNNKQSFSFNFTVENKKFSREDKYFACALLMPKDELMEFITRKDKNGKYLYLDDNMSISFRNINAVSNHFGVPFGPCSSRIFHVFQDLKITDKNSKFSVENCKDKAEYRKLKREYTIENQLKDLEEVAPDYKERRTKMINHLIDSLHYRSWDKMSEIAKRKLLVNLVKSDSVNEGVIHSEEEAKAIINNYIASGGSIYDGKLITKDGEFSLSDEQLVVLGEFELYKKTLERGLIRGIAKSNPRLEYLTRLDYKEAINSINEKDLTNYIRDLHSRLFSKLSFKYGEQRGGQFRNGPVSLAGTNVSPVQYRLIPQLMDNISWRILQILKEDADNKLSNSEYLDRINECIYEMIRMQPFPDGNKRTSRLLSNILYQEKGIPYVIVPTKEWKNYVNAWSSDDHSKYNELMNRMILESYEYFYGSQSINEAANTRVKGHKIIMSNRRG